MRTFAVAKVIIALAKCYQYAEKEQFSFRKGVVGCFFFMCIYRCLKSKMTLKRENKLYYIKH